VIGRRSETSLRFCLKRWNSFYGYRETLLSLSARTLEISAFQSPAMLYRQDVGRAILLGLEFLIAGDIIRTVVVAPTLQNVLVLGVIVLIRTFLSLSLQLEIEGKLPWRRDATRPD